MKKLFNACCSLNQRKQMSHAILCFCLSISVTNKAAVVLSVLTGVAFGGYGYRQIVQNLFIWAGVWLLWNSPAVSATVDNVTTCYRSVHLICTGHSMEDLVLCFVVFDYYKNSNYLCDYLLYWLLDILHLSLQNIT